MKAIIFCLTFQLTALAATFQVTDSTDFLNMYFYKSKSGDTLIFHCPVYTSAQMNEKVYTFIGIDTVPRIKWHGNLTCTGSTLYLKNIDFQGDNGGEGGHYCAYESCGSCDGGGRGESGLILSYTAARIENCSFIGGEGGLGGVPATKYYAVGPCDPCGSRCQDGDHGYGMELSNESVADTLQVGFDSLTDYSLKVDSSSSLQPMPTVQAKIPQNHNSYVHSRDKAKHQGLQGREVHSNAMIYNLKGQPIDCHSTGQQISVIPGVSAPCRAHK